MPDLPQCYCCQQLHGYWPDCLRPLEEQAADELAGPVSPQLVEHLVIAAELPARALPAISMLKPKNTMRQQGTISLSSFQWYITAQILKMLSQNRKEDFGLEAKYAELCMGD